MTDEKIIAGLEAIVADMQEEVDEWKDYSDSELSHGLTCGCEWWYKALQTLKDALALLKAQEPRLMTLEELAAAQKTPIWRETKRAHKDLYNGWMLAYDIQRGQGITGTRQGMTEPNGRVGWCKLDDYGKTWRCWTSKPTDEQRETEPWE